MVLIEVLLEMVTDVGAPLFVNVAMSSGTVFAVGVEVQLPPVVHSPPPQVVPQGRCYRIRTGERPSKKSWAGFVLTRVTRISYG
jgi:hypothetical protein